MLFSALREEETYFRSGRIPRHHHPESDGFGVHTALEKQQSDEYERVLKEIKDRVPDKVVPHMLDKLIFEGEPTNIRITPRLAIDKWREPKE